MDIDGRRVWQQAAGDTDRNYVRLCLNWDVILNGPGYAGAWPDCVADLREAGRSERKITDLRRFSEDIQPGQLVVLRVGTSRIHGVGEVVGGYEHREEFGDVDGWDLQHVRRVRWLWESESEPQKFHTYALKQGDTTQPLNEGAVTEWLRELDITDPDWNRPLADLPEESDRRGITTDAIAEQLFDQGIASSAINELVEQIGELTRIAKWYRREKKPSEHETVAYLVVPMLRALGWTPQRMAVEWNRLDIALFARLPREDATVQAVVEAKKMAQSCLTARSQALRYAEGKDKCDRLIVTDGIRYGVYLRPQTGAPELRAYLNLTRLRREYPVYDCLGAAEALFAMTPEWDAASADPAGQD